MRNRINRITVNNVRVSAIRRNRSVVVGLVVRGVLDALQDARYLLTWFSRPCRAALEVLKTHPRMPAASCAMARRQPAGFGGSPSCQGLGGPGSRLPSRGF